MRRSPCPRGAADGFSRALILVSTSKGKSMNQSLQIHAPAGLRGHPTTSRIAVISSSWHRDIVVKAHDAVLAELERSRWPADHVDRFEVPGAFEIPLHAKKLAHSGRYDAIIAIGLVVDGGIYRHEFVASAVIDALMRVQIESGVPVLSAVLTPRHFHEHDDHRSFFAAHFVKKGTEAARACLETIAALGRIEAMIGGG
jgi:6,7-dimethyl-8-ribityllumazine synthase